MVHVTDNHTDMPSADAEDIIYAVAYTPELNQQAITAGDHLRGAPGETQSVKMTLPSCWQGERVYVNAFVMAAATAMRLSACPDTVYRASGETCQPPAGGCGLDDPRWVL